MSIQLISVSYRHAPLSIRERFGFGEEAREQIRAYLMEQPVIEECVLIATCNRTELYCYGSDCAETSEVFGVMQAAILRAANLLDEENVSAYLRFYQDQKASHHLFYVAAGLDSMVIGEDQILGQVKDALEEARAQKTTGIYLNTLFRYAVTGAKKVKTDTNLSKMPVSTATIAIKAALEAFDGSLEGRKLMLIGASGKIGSIVLKDLQDIKGVEIYTTTRRTAIHGTNLRYIDLPFADRYEYLDDMDVIISATSSPHYTITADRYFQSIVTKKKRAVIDLAVPLDIEQSIADDPTVAYYNIDDFDRISKENNEKKQQEALLADEILVDYETKFEQWRIFKKYEKTIDETVAFVKRESEKKGVEYAVRKLFYRLRDDTEPEELETLFASLKECDRI